MKNSVQNYFIGACCLVGMVPMVHAATDWSEACQQLRQVKVPGMTITKAQWQPVGPLPRDPHSALTGASGGREHLPEHCQVQGVLNPYVGVDQQHYGTHFEVRLPVDWNHSLLFQGGGGMDGFLAPAIGAIPSHRSRAKAALIRGYTVVSMDGGHPERTASFGFDQQARINYAYASIGEVTIAAKVISKQFYGQSLEHSIFMGCSNGGREAMVAAQRYPNQFDGIIAGDPGFHLSAASIGEAWDSQLLMSIAPKNKDGDKILAQALTVDDLNLLSQAVLKQCDALDGIKDGLINNYQACHFSVKTLTCKADQNKNCLTPAKVQVIDQIFKGAHDSQGNALYSSWPYDAGVNTRGWRMWKLGSSKTRYSNAWNITLGGDSLPHYFMTPPLKSFSSLDFDFDKDPQKLSEMAAMNDATSTFLSSFIHHGGKLIIFQGVSDPVFSADDIAHWYQQLVKNSGHGNLEQTQQFARLFMIPGMTHCGGGPALDNFDPLTALENWLDHGKAPQMLPAHGVAQFRGKSQPLCPFPEYARYVKGDPDQITSYRCTAD
ncbi:tannase/feruloyl esterase family alpha/beta hydrolase [Celerinatantimonas sp. YJH-8]|uniref:tannase/feruloyl esterase family alpha/beta hydrolase n=1 Tax=Celerinatantimonas sp. YJH-8 TaxID=3228714 RepID=UPI0038CB9AE9